MPRLQALREQDIDPGIQPDIQAGKELMEFVSNDALMTCAGMNADDRCQRQHHPGRLW